MKYVRPNEMYDMMNSGKKRLISIDVGKKYTGLAITDDKLRYSSSLETFKMDWYPTPLMLGQYFKELIWKKKVGGLLIGFSATLKHLHKPEHREHVDLIRGFLLTLFESGCLHDILFTLVDESYSTVRADFYLKKHNQPVNRMLLNTTAAKLFTKWWLDKVRGGRLYSSLRNEQTEMVLQGEGYYWNAVRADLLYSWRNNQTQMVLQGVGYGNYETVAIPYSDDVARQVI